MKDKKSTAAYREALRYIPGGVNSPVRAFSSIGRSPLFIQKAQGPFITDIDNRTYIDYCLSWGVHILGHNHPSVISAVTKTLKKGTSFGAPTREEVELARRIIDAMPSIEKIRFVSSGTEAVMSAVRLARAFTKRKKIIKFDGCYHGHADHLLVAGGSGLSELAHSSSEGVPEEFVRQTISVPFNDREAVTEAFTKYRGEVAALIVEPVPANMGVILPEDGFLPFLANVTKENDALLIFDEVITGFRFSLSGAQGYYGIDPDLTCLGKIIGGGFPVGAFGGRKEIMDMLAPLGPVYQAGTLSGNPVAMSAGIAVLKELTTKKFYREMNTRAAEFTERLTRIGEQRGVRINACGPMFSIFFTETPVRNYADLKRCDGKRFAAMYRSLLNRGIYLSPAQGEAHFISQSHTPALLKKTLDVIDKTFTYD